MNKDSEIFIEKVSVTPLHVPFTEETQELMRKGEGGLGMALKSDRPWLGGDFVICEVQANTGEVGVGEAFVWPPETGLTSGMIITVMKDVLGEIVLGKNPFSLRALNNLMDRNLARNEVAKGMIDMACYDLVAKILGIPVYDLLGGSCVKEIPLSGLVPLMAIDHMVAVANHFHGLGMKTLRLKLGRSVRFDREVVSAVRESVGEKVRLRVDYNQAYTPDQAIRGINAIEEFGIDFAEQPVTVDDFGGMAYVQKNVNVPLMAHEGCFGLVDIITLAEMGGIRVVGINGERPGGISLAMKAIDYASAKGLGVVLHNQPLGIGSAAMLHLAASRFDDLGHDVELLGDRMLEDDLVVDPIDFEGGSGKIPLGNGWGVVLDRGALEKYATGKTAILGI